MPRVSVVIPAFNAERTVGQAVESVLGQTYSDTEVVVIDDGSSDDTAAVVSRYGPPVRCISTMNGGVARARNAGMAAATGELLAFLDADDTWRSEKLMMQVALLDAHPRIGVVTTASEKVDGHNRPLGYVEARNYPDPSRALLLHSMVLGQISSPLIRKRLALETGGFNEEFSQCADWDFFIRLSLRAQFAVIEQPLVRYGVSEHNMSSDIALLERDTFAVLDRFFEGEAAQPYVRLRSRIYSNQWMILSGSYLHAGQTRAAFRSLLRGVARYPPNARRVLPAIARLRHRLLRPPANRREAGE